MSKIYYEDKFFLHPLGTETSHVAVSCFGDDFWKEGLAEFKISDGKNIVDLVFSTPERLSRIIDALENLRDAMETCRRDAGTVSDNP